jgi:hypothetical protein
MTVNTEHFRATVKLDRIRTRPPTTHNLNPIEAYFFKFINTTFSVFFSTTCRRSIFHIMGQSFWKKTNSEESVQGSLHLHVKAGFRLTDTNRNYIHVSNFTPRYQ